MFTFELVSIEGLKFSNDVYEVVLPTKDGYIGVFPHHMPLISLVTSGAIKIRRHKDDKDVDMELFAINEGVVEIDDKLVRVLVDEADHSKDVIEKDAQAALELAQRRIKEAKNKVDIQKAQSLLNVSKAKIEVAKIKRRRKSNQ